MPPCASFNGMQRMGCTYENLQKLGHEKIRAEDLSMITAEDVRGRVQILGHAPVIAEDLGVITADMMELQMAIGSPSMVVQFAWGSHLKAPFHGT